MVTNSLRMDIDQQNIAVVRETVKNVISDRDKQTRGTQIQRGKKLQEIEIKEKERRYTVPQGRGKNDQSESYKQKERVGRKMQRGGEHGESRGGDRNRILSGNNPCIQ